MLIRIGQELKTTLYDFNYVMFKWLLINTVKVFHRFLNT